jgi:RDD family
VLTFGVVGLIIGGSIFAAFWALVGQTPGMRLLSIHLADPDGNREIGFRRAIRRLLAIPVSLLPLGLGFFAILVSPERRAWHDRIAGTTVLYDEEPARAPWSQLPTSDEQPPEAAGSRREGQAPPPEVDPRARADRGTATDRGSSG